MCTAVRPSRSVTLVSRSEIMSSWNTGPSPIDAAQRDESIGESPSVRIAVCRPLEYFQNIFKRIGVALHFSEKKNLTFFLRKCSEKNGTIFCRFFTVIMRQGLDLPAFSHPNVSRSSLFHPPCPLRNRHRSPSRSLFGTGRASGFPTITLMLIFKLFPFFSFKN